MQFAPTLRAVELPTYQLDERRCGWKQSEQYTGLSPRGWNGTRASRPQLAQVAEYIWRCGRS
jgi:hypothetical protein